MFQMNFSKNNKNKFTTHEAPKKCCVCGQRLYSTRPFWEVKNKFYCNREKCYEYGIARKDES